MNFIGWQRTVLHSTREDICHEILQHIESYKHDTVSNDSMVKGQSSKCSKSLQYDLCLEYFCCTWIGLSNALALHYCYFPP